MPLSVTRAQFDQDWQFRGAVYDLIRAKAERQTGGGWDLDRWERVLEPIEFDTLLTLNFLALWENNGRFVDTVKTYEHAFDRVERAFRRLGFATASVLVHRAIELEAVEAPYFKNDLSPPLEIGAEIDRINAAAADVSDEHLTAAITAHAGAFTV